MDRTFPRPVLSPDALLSLALAARPTLDPEADAEAFFDALRAATGWEGALWARGDDAPLARTEGWASDRAPALTPAPGARHVVEAAEGDAWPGAGAGAVADLGGLFTLALWAPPGAPPPDADALDRAAPAFDRLADAVEVGRRHRRLREAAERPATLRAELLARLVALADLPAADQLDTALATAAELLGLGVVIVSRIDEAAGTYTVEACHAPGAPLEPGQVFPLGQTYCSITLGTPDVLAIEAMGASPYAAHPCYEAFGLESYIGCALTYGDGSRGTLNASDPAPRDAPFSEADREVLRVLGAWVVATADRDRADQALRESEARLHAVIDQLPVVLFALDADGRFTLSEGRGLEVLGLAPGELVGASVFDLYPPETVGPLREALAGRPVSWTAPVGDTLWETHAAPRFGPDGAPDGVLGASFDVTAREAARRALERERARYGRLVEHAADLIYQLDADGRITFINAAVARVLGYEADELIGRSFVGLVPEDHRAGVVAFLEARVEEGAEEIQAVIPAAARDGATVWLDQRVVRVEGEAGGAEYHVVARDVTERRRVDRELREARESAEAAVRAKETFLANVSHEMRTPLHAVLGLSRLLAAGPVSGSQGELVTGVSRAADTLLALIDDLLERVRLDGGEAGFHEAPFFLSDVLDDVRRLLTPVADEKGVAVEVDGPDGIDTLLGDAARLRQVLLNLGGNAVKFTDEGWVRITAAVERRAPGVVGLRFDVEDTGVGIPTDQQARIFEAFAQASEGAARPHGGTGLGLSIVRDLVERQGGTVAVESVEGAGSRFTVHLPVRLAEGADAKPPAPPEPIDDAPDLSGLRVLIVEDNPTNRFIARHQVGAWGMEAIEAASGQEALDWLAARGEADVVLMDLQMPGMDGLEATRRLREAGLTAPVVALTASALGSRRGRALGAGFNDFVLKPFEPSALRRRLALLLGRARPRPEETAAINRERLEASARGDADFERRLVEMFLAEAEAAAPVLFDATADPDRLRAEAHALRGQAGYVGAEALAEALARVESAEGPVPVEAVADATAALADAAWALRLLYPRAA